MRKTFVAALVALIIPTSAFAGADAQPNRYCENGDTAGAGITVETPGGRGLLVCRAGHTAVYHYTIV